MSAVKVVAVNETAARRRQDYVSLFMDLDRRRLLFGTEGRCQETVEAFRKKLEGRIYQTLADLRKTVRGSWTFTTAAGAVDIMKPS